MKKFYLLLVFSCLAAFILLTGYGAGPATAAFNYYIGAPGGQATTCATCHGSPGSFGAVTTAIRIFDMGTTNVATEWAPSTTYDVEVEVNHPIGSPTRFGFQCVAIDGSNMQAGAFTNPGTGISIVTLASGTEVAEHSSYNTSKIFTFQWTSPASLLPTGDVTFYAGGIAANGNGTNAGDGGSNAPTALVFPPTALPIELSDFSARQYGNSVLLEWVTATEKDNSHFVIEHSIDGNDFSALDQIVGAGTTIQTQHYRFTHNSPVKGSDHYYRLKQVDLDGSFTYSDIVTVYLETNINQISVYPIPAKNEVNVALNLAKAGTYTQTIVDLNGKVLRSEMYNLEAGEQVLKMNIQNLASGHYIFNLNNGTDRFNTSIIKF